MKRLKTIFGVNSFGANYASVYSLGWFWVCVIHFLDKIKTIVWVKTNDNNNCPFYNHFCPFSAKIMFIFHKKEVQMVILRCLTGLNITWFKNYGLRCKWRPWACLANFQNIATDKWIRYYHIWPFFANYMVILYKNEIQMVILRSLKSLNLNWFNDCDTKRKNAKNAKECFCTRWEKIKNVNICILCHNLRNNHILDLLSIQKWLSEPQFCER